MYLYNMCINNQPPQIITLSNSPSYGYYNFKITNSGFQFLRNYSSELS